MARNLLALSAILLACETGPVAADEGAEPSPPDPWAHVPLADGFDWPVGPPDGVGYRDAQPFGVNAHLGEDWNGLGGGNTDQGDPIHAIADGVVSEAWDHWGGWGQVVRIVHRWREEDGRLRTVESLYAHLDRIDVEDGDPVARGQRIGTLGNAHGRYLAHLHLELRGRPGLPLGQGYSSRRAGWLDPSVFISLRRPG